MQISVVVPVYNEEKYLPDCLNSILNQTYSDLEVIIVDDGSTDQSGEICDQFQSRDNRVKVIHKSNGGLISAWKCGVDNSKNDYICFVDSDDLIQKNHIKDMVEVVKKYSVDLVLSQVKKISDKKISPFIYTLKSGFIPNYREKFLPKILTDLDKVSERNLPPNRWGKLIQKQHIISNLKYVDDRVVYGEDLSIMFPIFCDIDSIYVIEENDNSYLYRYREGTMVSGYDKTRWLSIKLVYSNLKKVVEEKKNLPNNMMNQVEIDYFKALIDCYKNQIRSSNVRYKDTEMLIQKMNDFQLFNSSKSSNLKGMSRKDSMILWNIFHGNRLTNWFIFKLIEVRYNAQKKRK
ncbi:glycosyltransferase [Lactobacillus crispatus]|uniref:Glycosyltransferase n=1 Tax=Lactobacillus crispatus TaxID=47770 RepID=A0A7X4HN94_9LACO|nr:glycosyltransferase family 2 protein [Lactobacillus crispatus]MYN52861.1 glycosyltransferase [Lactobacillus crispatus]